MAQLGSGAPKCKVCSTTAYSQESITYDNQVYHKRCFRCAKCDSVVSLGKVAMIQGDLYCKNCFIRMFSEKGTYHVFGAKTLPKWMINNPAGKPPESPRSGSVPSESVLNSRTSEPSKSEDLKPPASPRLSASSTGAAKPKICVIDGCNNGRVNGKSWCEQHLLEKNKESESKATPTVQSLLTAIRARSVADVKELLHQHGVGSCLLQYNRKSLLQVAFVDETSVACGEAMVEVLTDYLKDLEADVAMLKDQMKPEQEDDKASRSGSAVRADATAASS